MDVFMSTPQIIAFMAAGIGPGTALACALVYIGRRR